MRSSIALSDSQRIAGIITQCRYGCNSPHKSLSAVLDNVTWTLYYSYMEQRFWSKVNKTSSCWLWQAWHTNKGYGLFKLDTKTSVLAHRLSYTMSNGGIPKGLVIDHLCSTPACVNPKHLDAVTQKENLRRGKNYKRSQTHCKHGHELFGQNLYIRPDGKRACKTCKNG